MSKETEREWLEKIGDDAEAIQDIPDELKNNEFYLEVLDWNEDAWQYMPEEHLTVPVCVKIVENDPEQIDNMGIPGFESAKVMLAAMQSANNPYDVFQYLKEEICEKLRLLDGKGIRYTDLPDDYVFDDGDDGDDDDGEIKSEEDAMNFVRENPDDFTEIPEQWRTKDVCLLAIASRGGVCKFIPEHLRSEDFFLEAVKVNTNGKALKYIPADFLTVKVCNTAIQLFPKELNANDLNGVGNKLLEKGVYDTAISILDRAVTLDPNHHYTLDTRGECYFAKGDFEKAINDFKKAAELQPHDQYYKDNLAKAEAALKSAKPATADKAPAQQSGRTCSACGHALKPTSKFCPSCGVKQVVVCGNCGKVPREGAKFCAGCGNKL